MKKTTMSDEEPKKSSPLLHISSEDRFDHQKETESKNIYSTLTPKKGKRRRKEKNKTLFAHLLNWGFTFFIWFCVIIGSIIVFYSYDLPDIENLTATLRRPSIKILASNGQVLAAYGDVYGDSLSLEQIPAYLPQAVMATEDRNFYHHFGIDPKGLLRATITNLRAGHLVQGGSSITQQLAKNLFLSPARNAKRKVQELMMAIWLEHKFTKDQIMTIYLNRVYLGAGIWGVDAAAKHYFGIPATQLSLYQSALLAGLLKAPSHYNPQNDLVLSDKRTKQVLINMVNAGYITEKEANSANKEGPGTVRQTYLVGRYFADWVREQAIQFAGKDRDIIVQTSIDMSLQKKAEAEMENLLSGRGAKSGVTQGAMVVLSPDGAIRAMVGGRNYGTSQFNRAVQSLRQPGSSFKAFLYLTAIEHGWKADDLIEDEPIESGSYRPENYSHKYEGAITLRQAFAKSSNVAAVRLIEKTGAGKVIDVARSMGITSPLHKDSSLALGTSEVTLLEMTAGFAPFANNGFGIIPYAFSQITDSNGEYLYLREGGGTGRVIDHQSLAVMTDLLMAVIQDGTGKAATLDRSVGGKTGTTQDYRDAWFIGLTSDYVAGVWLGNDDGTPLNKITGGSLPCQLWHDVIQYAEQSLPPRLLPGQLPEEAIQNENPP